MIWVAFGAALIWSQGSIDAAGQWIRGMPLLLLGFVWLLFLPVMLGLWVWGRPDPWRCGCCSSSASG